MLADKPTNQNAAMKRIVMLVALFACAASLQAAPPSGLGEIKEFSLSDTTGKQHNRDEWQESKAVLLLFIGLDCPVSNGYAPEIQRLVESYSARGVACYGVHADPEVTAELAAQHAKDYGLKFPILLDPHPDLGPAVWRQITCRKPSLCHKIGRLFIAVGLTTATRSTANVAISRAARPRRRPASGLVWQDATGRGDETVWLSLAEIAQGSICAR